MAAPRRWIRLDVGWDDSEWVSAMDPLAQLAWVHLLTYVKANGIQGRVRALSLNVFARKKGMTAEPFAEMIEAAQADGALEIDGDEWIITNWDEYQNPDPTAAERMRRHRASSSRLSATRQNRTNGVSASRTTTKPVTRNTRNVTPVTGGDGVTCRVTETGTVTETENRNADANASGKPSFPHFHNSGGVCQNDTRDGPDPSDGQLMAIVRSRFYAPDGKPPAGYDEGREFGIFAALREKEGMTGRRIAELIEGAAAIRDDDGQVHGELARVEWLKRGDKMTMRALYHSKSGLMPLAQLAEIKLAERDKSAARDQREFGNGKVQIKIVGA